MNCAKPSVFSAIIARHVIGYHTVVQTGAATAHVAIDRFVNRSPDLHQTILEIKSSLAKRFYSGDVVTYKQYGPAIVSGDILHLSKAFPLELYVANREDFIYDERFRFQM